MIAYNRYTTLFPRSQSSILYADCKSNLNTNINTEVFFVQDWSSHL